MFKEAIQQVRESIFPLFHFGPKGYGVLGTGFFITDQGHFLTAAHVIQALPPGHKIGYLGNIPLKPFYKKGIIPVNVLEINHDKDLAVGLIREDQLAPLSLSKTKSIIGESISLCGYPMPMIQLTERNVNKEHKVVGISLDVTTVRQYWQPTIKMDELKPDLILKKKFKSFITQHAALPGMSGGPIFNTSGEVVGLTSAVWPRKIPLKNKHVIDIENGIGVELIEIIEFLNQSLNLPA